MRYRRSKPAKVTGSPSTTGRSVTRVGPLAGHAAASRSPRWFETCVHLSAHRQRPDQLLAFVHHTRASPTRGGPVALDECRATVGELSGTRHWILRRRPDRL